MASLLPAEKREPVKPSGGPRYVTEQYQKSILKHQLQRANVPHVFEFVFQSIPIDLVGVQGDVTFGVEFKTTTRDKGVHQAMRNKSILHYSFLSVWEDNISQEFIHRVDDLPIGLLAVDSSIRCLSNPEKQAVSNSVTDSIREEIENEF